MPNDFAYFALLLWPLVAAALFRLLSVERALIWTILGGYLLLPQATSFNLPMIPALGKESIPNLTALTLCAMVMGRDIFSAPRSWLVKLLLALFIVSPVATVLTNREPILFENGGGLPGLQLYDAFSAVANQALFVLPFFLARRLLATEAAQREILWALMLAGLAYSIPMLIEVRLSPQLHVWIYGFFQHDFIQMMRQDGFRPIVFLYHGLLVAMFAMTALIATLALARAAGPGRRTPYVLAAGGLAVMLVLCKSLGATLYALVLAPIVLLAGRRTQIRIAALLALIALAYPLLRGADLVPVDAMLTQAEAYDPDRAQSLGMRLDNEGSLLAHAQQKILFGWGGWGRNVIYNADGRSFSVTDGRWIIVIGIAGWSGYLAEFGLLTLPLFLLAGQTWRLPAAQIAPGVGALALLHGANLIDLLPNASLIPFSWLVTGALLGHAELLQARNAEARRAPARDHLERARAGGPRTIL